MHLTIHDDGVWLEAEFRRILADAAVQGSDTATAACAECRLRDARLTRRSVAVENGVGRRRAGTPEAGRLGA